MEFDFFCRHRRGVLSLLGSAGGAEAVLKPQAGISDGQAAIEVPREVAMCGSLLVRTSLVVQRDEKLGLGWP